MFVLRFQIHASRAAYRVYFYICSYICWCVCPRHPYQMKNDGDLKFPRLHLQRFFFVFRKKWPWGPLASKNWYVKWISAYLPDCLVSNSVLLSWWWGFSWQDIQPELNFLIKFGFTRKSLHIYQEVKEKTSTRAQESWTTGNFLMKTCFKPPLTTVEKLIYQAMTMSTTGPARHAN